MTDDIVSTKIITNTDEELSFQEYFVKRSCEPRVKLIRFERADLAKMPKKLEDTFNSDSLKGIIFAPSNPFLSIEPILSVSGIKSAIKKIKVPKIAISPIVNGGSVKGPTDKIMSELGMEVNNLSIVKHYENLFSHLIIDQSDKSCVDEIENSGISVLVTNTLMRKLSDKIALAEKTLKALSE